MPTNDMVDSASATRPMSASLGMPFTKTMFDGLMSRWTRPWRWRFSSAVVRARPRRRHSSTGKPAAQEEFAAEIARGVAGFVNRRAPAHVVGQFHDVVKAIRAAANLEDVELALVAAGNRLEALHARELALERTVVVEGAPVNDLHRAVNAEDIPGEPDLAVAALADAPDERVIGDRNGRNVACCARRRVAWRSPTGS